MLIVIVPCSVLLFNVTLQFNYVDVQTAVEGLSESEDQQNILTPKVINSNWFSQR